MNKPLAVVSSDRVQRPATPLPEGPSIDSIVAAGLEEALASSLPIDKAITDTDDPLRKLYDYLKQPLHVPVLGKTAAAAMRKAFEQCADDMIKVADDAVDRAIAQRDEVRSYAAVMIQNGNVLCDRIEAEAARAERVALTMRHVRAMLPDQKPPAET